jgi:hypothetical protein
MCSNEPAATLPDQPSENHSLLLPGHPQAGTRLTVLSDLHFAVATSLPAIAIRRKREKQSNGWDRHVTLFPAMKPRRVDKHGRVPLNLFTKKFCIIYKYKIIFCTEYNGSITDYLPAAKIQAGTDKRGEYD